MDRSVELKQVLRILNIAFYRFMRLDDIPSIRIQLKEMCAKLHIKGTILVAPEGINGTLAGAEHQIRQFQQDLAQIGIGKQLFYKESYSEKIPFQRMLVKIKKEIIPLGDPSIKPDEFTGANISPKELKRWLDEGRDFELLDTRNTYEIEHGAFEKASHLNLDHFRNFPEKLSALSEEKRSKPLVMYCTGGVRCEKASVVALRLGFKEVYQLEGGILKYFEECGDSHYQGGCFVFDERVALDSQLQPVREKNETC
jgi:predicted sulfurtransferase